MTIGLVRELNALRSWLCNEIFLSASSWAPRFAARGPSPSRGQNDAAITPEAQRQTHWTMVSAAPATQTTIDVVPWLGVSFTARLSCHEGIEMDNEFIASSSRVHREFIASSSRVHRNARRAF